MRVVVACIAVCWFILLHWVADAVAVACDKDAGDSSICVTDEEVLLQVRLQKGTPADTKGEHPGLSLTSNAPQSTATGTAMLTARMQALLATSSDDEPVNATDLEQILKLVEDVRSGLNATFEVYNTNMRRGAEILESCIDDASSRWPQIACGQVTLQTEKNAADGLSKNHSLCRQSEVIERKNIFSQAGLCGTFRASIESDFGIGRPSLDLTSLQNFFAGFVVEDFASEADSCETATGIYQTKVIDCNRLQKEFEQATCQWHTFAIVVKTTCEELEDCRAIQGKSLAEQCEETKTAARRFEKENTTLDLVRCLADHLAAGYPKPNATIACDKQTNHTGALDITCPIVDKSTEEVACVSVAYPQNVSNVPGASLWVTTQYSDQSWFNEATNTAGENTTIVEREECDLER